MKTPELRHDSFILAWTSRVMTVLSKISLLQLVYALNPPLRWRFAPVDWYVLANVLMAILAFTVSSIEHFSGLVLWSLVYGAYRTFEIVVFAANIFVAYASPVSRGGPKPIPLENFARSIILLVFNYAEIILWFSIIYGAISSQFKGGDLTQSYQALSLSFFVMSSFGISPAQPSSPVASVLVLLQAGLGLFMTAAVLARFISSLRIPVRRQ